MLDLILFCIGVLVIVSLNVLHKKFKNITKRIFYECDIPMSIVYKLDTFMNATYSNLVHVSV